MAKIAIIADIHHGVDRGSKKGSAAKGLFNQFLEWAHTEKCDLIVDLGDRISDVDTATDMRLQAEVSGWFKQSKIPVRHINGNHEVDFLTKEQLHRAMGQSVETSTIELGGYHLIFWCAHVRLRYQVGIDDPSEAQLGELKAALEASSLPTILFSHVPLYGPGYTGHFVHENVAPEAGSYSKKASDQIREIVERSEKVVLCINGHTHWNQYQAVDGIHYISVPSLIELFTSYPKPNGAWSLLTLDKQNIRLKVSGATPIEYSFPIKEPLNHHWLNVDKEYSPAKIRPA